MTNSLDIYWHPDCFDHNTGLSCIEDVDAALLAVPEVHAENADRLRNIKSILERGPIKDALTWQVGRHATREEIELYTSPALLDQILAAESQAKTTDQRVIIDHAETVVNPGTMRAIEAAAGCCLDALDTVLAGTAKRAYCLIRPPGHHASRTLPDGYCMVNNIGVLAEHALQRGIGRIAVIDWDVHHGNGTQAGFYDRSDVFTISMHMPLGSWNEHFHPETGDVDEIGIGEGKGFNLNIPMMYGSGDKAYEFAMREIVMTAFDDYKPDLIIIANGQDANQFDLNGRNLVSMTGYRRLARLARDLADRHCGGRVIMVQEGGYAMNYTAFCAYATVEGLLKTEDPMPDRLAYRASVELSDAPIEHLKEVKRLWLEIS